MLQIFQINQCKNIFCKYENTPSWVTNTYSDIYLVYCWYYQLSVDLWVLWGLVGHICNVFKALNGSMSSCVYIIIECVLSDKYVLLHMLRWRGDLISTLVIRENNFPGKVNMNISSI